MKTKTSKQTSCQSDLHAGHMCELENQQEWDIIRQITDNPLVRCENCGVEANSSKYVCMPADLDFNLGI